MAENTDTGGELAMGGDVDAVARPAPVLARLIAEHRPAVEMVDMKVTATFSAAEDFRLRIVGVARYGDNRTTTWIESERDIDPVLARTLRDALVAVAEAEAPDIRQKVEEAAAGDLIVARRKGEL